MSKFGNFLCSFFIFLGQGQLGAQLNVQTLTEFEGFETTFYSNVSGKPFISLKYKSAERKRPKIGFLKFGMSFLEVKHLSARLDLGNTEPENLFSKWEKFLNQRAIRYATLEPVTLVIIDKMGDSFLLNAEKGKLSSSGKLVLWNNASIKTQGLIESFPRLSIYIDEPNNHLIIEKNKSDRINLLIR